MRQGRFAVDALYCGMLRSAAQESAPFDVFSYELRQNKNTIKLPCGSFRHLFCIISDKEIIRNAGRESCPDKSLRDFMGLRFVVMLAPIEIVAPREQNGKTLTSRFGVIYRVLYKCRGRDLNSHRLAPTAP